MPDINIVSGGEGGRKYVIFMGLLPLCPKSSGQDCSFMQLSGLCSELDCNLMLCDSQLGEVSIIAGLQGAAEFLELLERCTDLVVSTRNTVL